MPYARLVTFSHHDLGFDMVKKTICSLALAAVLLPAMAATDTVDLQADYPDRYIVQKGDTLWDIAGRFLNEPWLWPNVWEANPQIENPHLIYPGDEVVLRYRDGRPVVTVRRRVRKGTVRLSPGIRVSELDTSIPTIPIDVIQPFLKYPRVVTLDELENGPYVVSVGREAMIGKPGTQIFVRGISGGDATRYTVYRRGAEYVDPQQDGEILGYEAIHIADAVVEARGDPATLFVTATKRELLVGDRVFPVKEEEFNAGFIPRAPNRNVSGQIISVVEGVSQIGQYQVVVLNLGRQDGIETGHVLAVFQRGETIVDPYAKPPPKESTAQTVPAGLNALEALPYAINDLGTGILEGIADALRIDPPQIVTLPDEHAGTVMVFRPFERVSFALVMLAKRPMHVSDTVRNP
jgi:hypothetical protein